MANILLLIIFWFLFLGFLLLIDRTVKVWTGNEMERRGGEWNREMTAGRIQTCVPVGVQARIWSGILLAPQCPPLQMFSAVMCKCSVFGRTCVECVSNVGQYISDCVLVGQCVSDEYFEYMCESVSECD